MQWVSLKGCITLSGDASHPFLLCSGDRASQVVENATTIASALELAERNDVTLVLYDFQ